ncbi:hypothetical protein HBZS_117960 [Helicobacter bizzozeronii CCUG 35545]|nr:hypothetical protein HBZS_117960 [Helicobacter bizzozeronii CCUG 35545]
MRSSLVLLEVEFKRAFFKDQNLKVPLKNFNLHKFPLHLD